MHFHFIPTHSSWLNQVECWFSILSRGALQGSSFTSVRMLKINRRSPGCAGEAPEV